MSLNQKYPRVFYGWYVVSAGLIITLYTSGVVLFGFTAVFEPIAEEFNWSYAQISLAASLRGVEVGLLAPLMGILVDRWGPRKLVFGGSILVGLGFFILSGISSLGMFYVAFAFISIGISTCTGTVIVTAVVNWFRRKVGIATGIVVSGFGLGGLLVPVITVLIDTLTWRTAMLILGLGMVIIVLPLSLLIRHKPEYYGYQPNGGPITDNVVGRHRVPRESAEISVSAKQAIRGGIFWHLAIASMCHAFVISAVVTHLMPYLSSIGISRSVSSIFALVLPVASIGGRLGAGWLGDRLDSKRVYTISFILITVGLLFFGFTGSCGIWLLLPFVLTYSLGWGGSVTQRMALLRKYYGRSNFGTILGFVSGVMMMGSVAGAPIAGWVFDNWGSYQSAWFGFAVVAMLGSILVLTIPQTRSMVGLGDRLGVHDFTK